MLDFPHNRESLQARVTKKKNPTLLSCHYQLNGHAHAFLDQVKSNSAELWEQRKSYSWSSHYDYLENVFGQTGPIRSEVSKRHVYVALIPLQTTTFGPTSPARASVTPRRSPDSERRAHDSQHHKSQYPATEPGRIQVHLRSFSRCLRGKHATPCNVATVNHAVHTSWLEACSKSWNLYFLICQMTLNILIYYVPGE